MTKCIKCSKNEACYRVINKQTGQTMDICEYCEEPGYVLLETLSTQEASKEPGITKLGRLHLVQKTRKDFQCRICKLPIPSGCSCYSQHVEKEGLPFPEQSRLHLLCAQHLIDSGTEVVLPKSMQNKEVQ